jgi:hypothetical protein
MSGEDAFCAEAAQTNRLIVPQVTANLEQSDNRLLIYKTPLFFVTDFPFWEKLPKFTMARRGVKAN